MNADEGFLLWHLPVFIDVCAFVQMINSFMKSQINCSIVLLRTDGAHLSCCPLLLSLRCHDPDPVPAHSSSLRFPKTCWLLAVSYPGLWS